MKVINNLYRVKKITDQQKENIGIPPSFYPENQLVKVTGKRSQDGWYTIVCEDRNRWIIKEEYLLEMCIWEVL